MLQKVALLLLIVKLVIVIKMLARCVLMIMRNADVSLRSGIVSYLDNYGVELYHI